ncbi:MAG: ATP phosphoribosyltransferase regulatory subunit [Betaproteobacteria bacterium]|jgi:ATP phosphoribosyltransferase regulatory subunit|nr:ATP phosphoribosyltransferase regulatory subunit [Betaproteobacteria bacterium]
MSAWVLPDHIADVLPSEARHIEELRRELLDTARSYGYELVMPPLVEHLESLLSGTGSTLDLQTFKLVDQLSGRSLGVRADTTPQVARIDAHLLNRRGVARLCYCGPVLHTRADRPHATRDPLQFGAEIYGHAGLEADLEVLRLSLDCLQASALREVTVDLADTRVVRSLLAGHAMDDARWQSLCAALAAKDTVGLHALSEHLPEPARDALRRLPHLYGGLEVLDTARQQLRGDNRLPEALDALQWLAAQVQISHPAVRVTVDLADLRGYAYYSGARFAIYAQGISDALVRGGRYDEVGAVFGRNRPAAGFSLDVKELVAAVPRRALRAAIRAPWDADAALRAAVSALRARGETVVQVLPGHESEIDEFDCDRELVLQSGRWVVMAL